MQEATDAQKVANEILWHCNWGAGGVKTECMERVVFRWSAG
jgi:hypothetical protein